MTSATDAPRYITVCLVCGKMSNSWNGRGRTPKFCGGACRVRSKRLRDAGQCAYPAACAEFGHLPGCGAGE